MLPDHMMTKRQKVGGYLIQLGKHLQGEEDHGSKFTSFVTNSPQLYLESIFGKAKKKKGEDDDDLDDDDDDDVYEEEDEDLEREY